MYNGDSFFTLSGPGQVGLVLLSLCLAGLAVLAIRALPWSRILRAVTALVLFWGFVWLSPQIYYQYYRVIIPGLPQQWVIQALPTPREIIEILSFSGQASLSWHGQGALGWSLILAALIRVRP